MCMFHRVYITFMVFINKLSPGYHVVETNLPAGPRREYLVIKMNTPWLVPFPIGS